MTTENQQTEQRILSATRGVVDTLLDEGWTIISRNPTTLGRGRGIAEVKPNGVVTFSTTNKRK